MLLRLLLITALFFSRNSPAQQREADQDTRIHLATLTVGFTPAGDASVTIATDEDIDLEKLRHRFLPCNWKTNKTKSGYLQGTCRDMLTSDGTRLHGSIDLFPMLQALRAQGIPDILSYVHIPSAARQASFDAPRQWVVSEMKCDAQLTLTPDRALPPPLPLKVSYQALPDQGAVLIPLFVVLFVPPLVALYLKSRISGAGTLLNGPVGTNWLLLGTWIYWMSAIQTETISGYVSLLRIDSAVINLLISTAIFAAPPLLAMTGTLLAIASSEPDHRRTDRDLRHIVLSEASMLVPLGLLFMGADTIVVSNGRTFALSAVAAYMVWRLLAWLAGDGLLSQLRSVTNGDLYQRVHELAAKAGVKLNDVLVSRTQYAEDANAFALVPGRVAVTESLLGRLTRREVDAVMAHEIGHLQGSHPWIQCSSHWLLILVGAPMITSFLLKLGAPEWVFRFPIVLAPVILVGARISQRHEYSADAKAVALTGDPEAKIAALGKLAAASNLPLYWSSLLGSIISHPSMQHRAIAIADKGGMPRERALALLKNPELAAPADAESHYQLPPELQVGDTVFNTSVMQKATKAGVWAVQATLIFGVMAAGWLTDMIAPMGQSVIGFPIFLVGCAIVFWLHLIVDDRIIANFARRMEEALRPILKPAPGSTFVGLRGGDRIWTGGLLEDWDVGYIRAGETLSYTGQRTRFELTPDAISSVEVVRGPFVWKWDYAVVVRGPSFGSLCLRATPLDSKRVSLRLKAWLDQWRTSPQSAVREVSEELLPHIPPTKLEGAPRWVAFMYMILQGTKVLVLSAMCSLGIGTYAGYWMFTVLMAPFLFVLCIVPSLLRGAPPQLEPQTAARAS
ncbi:MAG: M48 family metalloprotease [Bryobacterales bacterium]|nr:M48 family metalloprotease [Bryobacterales bacterium]